MFPRLALLASALTAASLTFSPLVAAEPSGSVPDAAKPTDSSSADVRAEVDGSPSDEIAALRASVSQLQLAFQNLGSAVTSNTANLAELSRQHELVAERLAAASQQIDGLKQDQQRTSERLRDVGLQLEQIVLDQQAAADQARNVNVQLEQISRDTGSSRVLRFDNIQDNSARQDFRKLVDDTTPRRGTLIIENKMDSGQFLMVNQQEHYFRPGETRRLSVDIGTVSTKLPGQRVVNWTIGGPKYEQIVFIQPDNTRVASSGNTVYFDRPVYAGPPIYVGDSWNGFYRY